MLKVAGLGTIAAISLGIAGSSQGQESLFEDLPFGIFVELGEYYIEGMVHLSALHDDYYHFREESLSLLGEHTGRMYRRR